MGLVPVSQLKPGMILSSAIKNKTNTLALDAGTELTQARINSLALNKIVYADIKGEGTCVENARNYFLSATPCEDITLEEKIHHLFSKTQMDHPFVRELMRNSARRLHPKYITKTQL